MAYPIKYIENNLVFNHDGECFAYYEPVSYTHLIKGVRLQRRGGTYQSGCRHRGNGYFSRGRGGLVHQGDVYKRQAKIVFIQPPDFKAA